MVQLIEIVEGRRADRQGTICRRGIEYQLLQSPKWKGQMRSFSNVIQTSEVPFPVKRAQDSESLCKKLRRGRGIELNFSVN